MEKGRFTHPHENEAISRENRLNEILEIENKLEELRRQMSENRRYFEAMVENTDFNDTNSRHAYEIAKERYYYEQDKIIGEIDNLQYRKTVLEGKK